MSNEPILTIVGNLTADPELRHTQNGRAVASFTIASTPRSFDRQTNEWVDGEALFLRCSAWQELGEHCAASLAKGARVIAQGRLKSNTYTTKENETRTSLELDVDEIGPSLRYATAQVTRTTGNKNQAQNRQQAQRPAQDAVQGDEPWGQTTAGSFDDETPF